MKKAASVFLHLFIHIFLDLFILCLFANWGGGPKSVLSKTG